MQHNLVQIASESQMNRRGFLTGLAGAGLQGYGAESEEQKKDNEKGPFEGIKTWEDYVQDRPGVKWVFKDLKKRRPADTKSRLIRYFSWNTQWKRVENFPSPIVERHKPYSYKA